VIPVALSVVAVVVAGISFLVAVGAQRRSAQAAVGEPGLLVSDAEGAVPTARGGGHQQPDPRSLDPRSLRDVAVIRYDALQEMSGQLSFSLAILNAQGDGIVLTSINGRAETRTYAKAIVAGKSQQELSPEEAEAIRVARIGQGPATPPRVVTKPKITSQTGTVFSQTR
jgi:hypothetical protein